MRRSLQLILPLILAAGSIYVMEPRHWGTIDSGLIFSLSIFAAAILVRLSRGVPSVETNEINVEQIEEFLIAYKKSMQRMIALLSIFFISILGTVFIELIYDAITNASWLSDPWKGILSDAVNCFLIFMITFSFVRSVGLVKSDYDLSNLQSRLILQSVRSKKAKEIREKEAALQEENPFKSRDNYGQLLQH